MRKNITPPASGLLALLAVASVPGLASAQTWNAAGNGTWSTAANWSPSSVPGTGNTATLNDASANRAVTYDSAASGTVGTLVINQSTANVVNAVDLQRSLTLTNALTLGASAGTAQLSIGSNSTSGYSLASANGVTLNSGGVLALTATTNGANTGFQASSTNANTAITLSGGTLALQSSVGGNTTAAASNTVNGNLTMTSGAIVFDNNTGAADRRLSLTGGNISITGGSITSTKTSGATATIQFNNTSGASSVTFNPAVFDSTRFGINIQSNQNVSFSTNQTLGSFQIRDVGIKTVTSTATGNGIGSLQFNDTNSAAPNSAITLRLGSNLNLNSGATQPNLGGTQTPESGRIDAAIDTNGFTLDLSNGGNSGSWAPALQTASGTTTNVWTLSGAGSIKANGFNLSAANVTTNLGAGLTLEAAGGNNVANNLGNNGTIASGVTFRYTGSAAAGTPSTLTLARDLPNLTVAGAGALRLSSAASANITTVSVSSGTLDLDGASRSFANLNLTGGTLANGTYSLTSGNFTGLQTGVVSGVLSGASSFVKDSAGVLTLSGNNNFGGGGTFTINQGTIVAGHVNAFGSTSQVIVNGGAADLGGLSINKIFNLGANGGSISNGVIARNSANNATFTWQAGSVSASITEAGGGVVSINKTGPGTLTLSGNNAHSGANTISAGTVIAGNSGAFGTGSVTVSGGALDIGNGGALTLALGSNRDLALNSGSLLFDLGSASDQITGGGTGRFLLNGGSIVLNLVGGFSYGSTYQLFSGFAANSVVSGGLVFSGYDTLAYSAQLGTDGLLSFAAVPEPSAFAALAGLGAIGLAAARRRRR